ncbi:MAG: undecaprenyl-diphosphate phosphatase [Bacteroidia bacterium]|nr:undecaprenyl-diphosphate phosphatase [Bacteroidia bacterium]
MTILQAIIIAIVEGITEFLPVSSTGHMIITSSLMGIASNSFTKVFTIAIQFGAILSVLVLYWKKFLQSVEFYVKLLIAFIPAAIFGKLFNDQIDALLENVTVVAVTLIIGGVFLLFIDKWLNVTEDQEKPLTRMAALKIGLFQCVAMIPGVSRSAATIIGGLTQKLTRKNAAEFSFFLAVPTMFAATAYKMLKFYLSGELKTEQITLLTIGNVVAFIVALLAIKGFIGFIAKYGFKVFGYYRIVVGGIILLLSVLGIQLHII